MIPEPARKIMKRLSKWLGPHKAIEIVEEDGVRVLQIGGNAIQSAMRLDAPDRIELDYVRAMMAFLLFHPSPRDVLLLGLGGGSMARFIHQRMPRTRVTVVEIDPGVVNVARRYFHFPEEDARLGIVIGDGAEVVPQRPASCDVLVVDGFVNGSPAKRLCTRSFYDGAFARSGAGGRPCGQPHRLVTLIDFHRPGHWRGDLPARKRTPRFTSLPSSMFSAGWSTRGAPAFVTRTVWLSGGAKRIAARLEDSRRGSSVGRAHG